MTATPLSFDLSVNALRPYLLRYAQLQLRDVYRAEDAVSETIVAALSKPDAYLSKAELKTYLVGILKYKILDQFRANKNLVFSGDHAPDEQDQALASETFESDGHFSGPVNTWPDPSDTLQSKQFFLILDACVEQLPPNLSRIFMMREWLELSSSEICKQLDISSTNLHVMLHRTRMRLRACLDLRWFDKHTQDTA